MIAAAQASDGDLGLGDLTHGYTSCFPVQDDVEGMILSWHVAVSNVVDSLRPERQPGNSRHGISVAILIACTIRESLAEIHGVVVSPVRK